MIANTIAPADLDILRAIAAGDRVHHMRRRRLTNIGLVTSAGDLTKLGAEAIAEPAPKPAKRRSKTPRECGCGCGEMTGGGLWRPGHDARWAALAGKAAASSKDSDLERAVRKSAPVGTSDALVEKAVRLAETALAKQAAKAA